MTDTTNATGQTRRTGSPHDDAPASSRAAGPHGDPAPIEAETEIGGEEEERPRKRRSRLAHNQYVIFFNFVLTLGIFAVIIAGGAVTYGLSMFDAEGPTTQDVSFNVPQGATVISVGNRLESRGIIESAQIFDLGRRAYGESDAIQAGDYDFPAGASMREILGMMQRGEVTRLRLTIPEGWTVHQAMERIAAAPELVGDMPSEDPPEGSLVADTMVFGRGTERASLIADMRSRQDRLVREVWESRDDNLPIDTIEEFVTLASIVEKETGFDGERPMVAGVFVNRLREGMRLQSDPTFLYGLFGGEGKPSDRPIYRSDIESDTPYNTYRINGLPPGPIAVPGRAALEATARPAETDALYFVADGTGGHAFASTLEQHNANVAQWRRIEAERAARGETDENDLTEGALAAELEAEGLESELLEPTGSVPLPLSRPEPSQ